MLQDLISCSATALASRRVKKCESELLSMVRSEKNLGRGWRDCVHREFGDIVEKLAGITEIEGRCLPVERPVIRSGE